MYGTHTIVDEMIRDFVRVYLEDEMAAVMFLKSRAVGADRERLDAELDRLLQTRRDLCEIKKNEGI